jgi:hypothetical protein
MNQQNNITARAVLEAVIKADREYDAAHDALCDAKRESGNWRVNPLKNDHPAVRRKRVAIDARQAALALAEEFLEHGEAFPT